MNDLSEQPFTCDIGFLSVLSHSGSSSERFDGFASTTTDVFDNPAPGSPCRNAALSMRASYRDSTGQQQVVQAAGRGSNLSLFVHDVASGFSVEHDVVFIDCISNCSAEFTTHPK